MKNTKPRGGKRPGAGRKAKYIFPMRRQTIRIPDEHLFILKEIDSNLSQSIRAMLDDQAVRSAIREIIIRKRENHATASPTI